MLPGQLRGVPADGQRHLPDPVARHSGQPADGRLGTVRADHHAGRNRPVEHDAVSGAGQPAHAVPPEHRPAGLHCRQQAGVEHPARDDETRLRNGPLDRAAGRRLQPDARAAGITGGELLRVQADLGERVHHRRRDAVAAHLVARELAAVE